MIKLLLISSIIGLLLYYKYSRNSYKVDASKKILGILFVIFAIFSVIFPELLNSIAQSVGIGRGADLLLYFLTIAYLFTLLSMYMRNRQTDEKITQLARKIALSESKLHNPKSKK